MRDRAYRRWQLERKKKKVSRHWNNWWYVFVDDENKSPETISYGDRLLHKNGFTKDPKRIGSAAHTPKPCSCYMCGNPRKHFGEITRQEQKAPIVRWDDWDLEKAA